ncbi:MAG: DUF4142 domain-containing protein [Armatimonadota bacterium]|nr:DUF305 domain-containing protein [bacterium]
MRRNIYILLVSLVVMTFPLVASAQTSASQCGVAPAALGAGPASQLSGLSGPAFDQVYARGMYQQHADIAALGSLAVARSSSPDIRNLAGHIRNEQLDLNRKLASWYSGQNLTVNNDRYNRIIAGLNCSNGMAFSVAWAQAIIPLLQQSGQASDLAQTQAANPPLRNQAKIVSRSAFNETKALQQWLQTGYTGRGSYNPYYYGGYGPYYSPYYSPFYGGYYGPYYGSGGGFSLGFGFYGH